MTDILSYYTLRIILLTHTFSICTTKKNSVFEYGHRVPGDHQSIAMRGCIPKFVQTYTQNIMPKRFGLEKKYTYFRVEYDSPMSAVNVTYDETTHDLTFLVQFPFSDIPFGVIGHSVSLDKPVKRDLNPNVLKIFRQYGLTKLSPIK